MKNKLFPPEIIEFTVENYFVKQHRVSSVIYIMVLLTTIVVLTILPIIKIDITAQSRGIIRSKKENNLLASGVSGKVKSISLNNNQHIKKGDTLVLDIPD